MMVPDEDHERMRHIPSVLQRLLTECALIVLTIVVLSRFLCSFCGSRCPKAYNNQVKGSIF